MKSLKEKLITEASQKYCIQWIDTEGQNFRMTTNDYKAVLKDIQGKHRYYEVMDMSKDNFSEPEALVEWSGVDGYWANAYLASTEPDKAPKWCTSFKGNKLKKIEQCKK